MHAPVYKTKSGTMTYCTVGEAPLNVPIVYPTYRGTRYVFARVVSRNGNGTICWVEDYANNDKGRAKSIREHHFGVMIPDERMLASMAALLIAKAQQLTTALYLQFWIDSEESGELVTRVDFGNPPDLLRICLAAHELSPSSFPRFKNLR